MSPNLKITNILFLIFLSLSFSGFAQQPKFSAPNKIFHNEFYELRGTNAIDAAAGGVLANADLPDPSLDLAFRIGYKRFVIPSLSVGVTYNKFNIAFDNGFNQGFMSFDLNLEYTVLPHNRFSPFIFAGGGYNAANYFDQTSAKYQGGGGLEFIVTDKVGIKIMADYNGLLSDDLDGLELGDGNDAYWRFMIGTNIYFGGGTSKQKHDRKSPTIINSNPIIPKN